MVDRAEFLVAVPGQGYLVVRVPGPTAVAQSVLLHPAADLVEDLPTEFQTWQASSTGIASGSSSRMALA